MEVDVGERGQIARVTTLSTDRQTISLAYRNGDMSTATADNPIELTVGDVVIVSPQGRLQKVSPETWPLSLQVGVVKLRLEDVTVLESSSWRLIPTSDVDCSVGDTVAFDEQNGVVRVLDGRPLRHFDDGQGSDLARFRPAPDPDLSFNDFGGLPEVVERARELIELPLAKHEALTVIGAKAIKGVLFTGLPGTGKTMLAKIIANEAGAAFYSIKGPQVFSKWFGETEETLRNLFEDAAAQPKSVIFFDEIDSVAGSREGESHRTSRSVVAQLLTLMDGFEPDDNVVVIAATNRPQDIDVALRRPGRFDWTIEFPLPNETDRLEILKVAERRHKTDGFIAFEAVVEATVGWSAADLTAVWSEAAILAVKDEREAIAEEDLLGGVERVELQRRQAGPNERTEPE